MQGHNCNCTKQEVADLVGLIINDDSDVVDVTSETSQPTQDICQDVPHGFVSEPRTLFQRWHVNALQGLGRGWAGTAPANINNMETSAEPAQVLYHPDKHLRQGQPLAALSRNVP